MHEIVVMNPAPRKRRRNSTKRRSAAQKAATRRLVSMNRSRRSNPAKRRTHRVRRAVHAVAGAVRRRIRRYARRSNPVRHYRRRRNPISMSALRLSGIGSMVGNAAWGGAGAIGVDYIMARINPMLPASLQPQASGVGVSLNDAVKVLVTVMLGRLLSKPTRGKSVKMAEGSLVVQAYNILSVLTAQYFPQALQGLGYMSPNLVVPGTNRISPMARRQITAPRMNAFLPAGPSPMLNAFLPRGQSALLNGGVNRTMQREGVRYR